MPALCKNSSYLFVSNHKRNGTRFGKVSEQTRASPSKTNLTLVVWKKEISMLAGSWKK